MLKRRGAAAGGRFPAAAPPDRAHPKGLRRLFLASLAGGMFLAATLGWKAVAHGDRRADPSALEEAAREALGAARAAEAQRRAPVNFALADSAYAAGLVTRRREDLRWGLLRDYRSARAELETAVRRAEAALSVSERMARRDRSAAARTVAAAESRLDRLSGLEDRIWMPQTTRRRLQRSRALAAEARSLLSAGAHAQATTRAREAEGLAREVGSSALELTGRFVDADRLREWRAWVAETVSWSRRTGRTALVVDKDAHVLQVYQAGRLTREYHAELGWNNVSDKRVQGDGATPEGRYAIVQKKDRGSSRYHRALLLDYPNRDDLRSFARLREGGAISASARPGGLIEIHGEGGRGQDWTDGCVAVTNAQMDWLFSRVTDGTPVTIVGSLQGDGTFATVARRLRP